MSRGNLITVSRCNMWLNEQLLRFQQFDLLKETVMVLNYTLNSSHSFFSFYVS